MTETEGREQIDIGSYKFIDNRISKRRWTPPQSNCMPGPDPRAYLDPIGRRCEQAASLPAGMTLEEFLNDTDAQDRAFAWNHNIGEAVN